MLRGTPRRQAVLAVLALVLLALCAEVVGIGVIRRIDLGRHVASPGYAQADYYPPLLALVKAGVALLAARLAWRALRARSSERAGLRLLAAIGQGPHRPLPRVRVELSLRLWAASFVLTSVIYLVHADAEAIGGAGRWPLLAPWLHTSALPVFAVLSVVVALLWRGVSTWLAAYEGHARDTLERGRQLFAAPVRTVLLHCAGQVPSLRRLPGNSLHQRPPPPLAA